MTDSSSRPTPRTGSSTAVPRPAPRLDSGLWLGANYWSRHGSLFMWRDYDDEVVREELRTLREHGTNVTRSFLFWPDFHPAPDRIDEDFVERYRQFLRTSAEMGMPTIPTFLVGHMSGEDWDVPWREGRNLYTNGFMLGQQAFFIREIVRRIGTDPAVAGWLISNEFPIFAGPATPDEVRAWGLICTQAVRAGGSQLPVSLGDGAWTMETTGKDNGFRIRRQDDLVDFVGPHTYPMGDDQVRVHTAAAWACEMSHFGKPVVMEEFGVSAALSSERNAAHYYRQVLHHTLLAGATGWLAWNNTDFALESVDPYRHRPFELGFGITRTDGTPKPALAEIGTFRRLLDAVDFDHCARPDTETSIMIPSHLEEHPRVSVAERTAIATVSHHAYLAAKAAGLTPALSRELDAPRRSGLVLIPSNKLLTAPTFDLLLDWAREGSHVYLSWFAGAGGSHRGAWWPPLERLIGASHTLRYGLNEPVDPVVTWEFAEPLGDLKAGDTLRFPVSGPADARAMLPLDEETADCVVVARDGRGRPALVRRDHGRGAVYLATYPVEFFGSATPDAHRDDDVHRLYRALAAQAGVRPFLTVDDPRVHVDGLMHASGQRYAWLVNVSGDTVTAHPELGGADCRLEDVLDGLDLTEQVVLEPFGAVVARVVAA
ncbi:beta-mannosidase [Streptomyces sp. NBC_01724]|uniref:cellulase family glycosylhydrolase n=1 Tax=unclassified Streptomyces TaxID=2593676 RepID=UPI002E337200|nr:cellulase family glycosylhydrolase [Streptomyces sp. NBC_01724]WTE56361.1 beta-mannosidase [Streptomyces sp. NBC_01620]WTE64431.1 beta-mannosidase [Streptomyces sp. NBC_01617]WTI91716.1 beta-mannosidase [Streptomyces sp. NBC_00724]